MNAKQITSRRNFMDKAFGAGVFGLNKALFPSWMPRLAFRDNTAPGDVLIVVFLRGGMDGLNAVVPFGEGAYYYDRRPTLAVPEPGKGENAAIDLNGFFGLNPLLRPLKEIYDAGALTVVHATGSIDPSRSHFEAMEYMEKGTPGDKSRLSGWLNRHLISAAWQNNSPFRAVGLGASVQGSLRGDYDAMSLQSIADHHLNGRWDQIAHMKRAIASLYQIDQPVNPLEATAAGVYKTVDLLASMTEAEYKPENGVEYSDHEFSKALNQIAQLIKAEVGLEVACVDLDGWDTHENQEGQFAYNLGELGRGLSAFYTDMGADRMKNVTVVTMSEFGRRVEENASRGTDHGHGNCMFIMGGGATGSVYADWRGLAPDALDEGDVAITTDYRDVLSEILTKRVLNPAVDQVFPDYSATIHDILKAR